MQNKELDVHVADREEVKERMDIVTHGSRTQQTAEQFERTSCALNLAKIVLRDYMEEPQLAQTVRAMQLMLSQSYLYGYCWVIEGRDPQREARKLMDISSYIASVKTYRDMTPAQRLSLLWEDIGVMTHCATCTLEDIQAQKYRSYGCDCGMLSTLGTLYGFLEMYDELTPSIEQIVKDNEGLSALDDGKMRVAEFMDENPELFYGTRGFAKIREGMEKDPTVLALLEDGLEHRLSELSLKMALPPADVKAMLSRYVGKKVTHTVDKDGMSTYKLL